VSGLVPPYRNFCEDCLDARLRREFDEMVPGGSEVLYLEARLLAILASRPVLVLTHYAILPSKKRRAWLEGEGAAVVEALRRTICEVAPPPRG